ncbi:thiamine phosphate synthase [Solemya velesiana gill symbiont]|uniref:thiamine phosphate synthase n=1 Tax=Solemya velesiana gill symbiont TaxID=1918948 RepID=UPI001FEBA64D|nr:thiamine phosphate synthase [Solemya velesiana gill symbiont]
MFRLKGLYAITDSQLAANSNLIDQVAQALAGGANIIQYRDKSGDPAKRLEEAQALLRLCREHAVPLIINDDVELAAQIGADGVHLGRGDPDLDAARSRLGREAIIGVSCYNQFERALSAQQAEADYIAFGRFFPSSVKPEAVQADIDLLHRARDELELPTVAIGGITPENGGALIKAGADMLAVIHGVFGQADVKAACERFTELFKQKEVSPT